MHTKIEPILKGGAILFGVVFLLITLQVTMLIGQTHDETSGLDFERGIEHRLNEIVLANDIPSLSVALVRGDAISQFHFGTLDRGSTTPVTGQSLYQIASLSKLMTGLIIASLVDEGRLNYDAPFVSYLADDLDRDTVARLSHVTLLQLLQHQSGIMDADCKLYRERREGEAWQNGYIKEDLLQDLDQLSLSGRNAGYSSCAYAIAGLIAAQATAMPYEVLLQTYVATPLELEHTVIVADPSTLVTPYDKRDRDRTTEPSSLGLGTAASGVFSSLDDLAKIMVAQIAAHQDGSGPLILTGRTEMSPDEGLAFGVGLFQVDHPKGLLIGLDGDADGYAGFYLFHPERGVGVVLLTGSGGDWVMETALDLLSSL